jgi:hypothetical protein
MLCRVALVRTGVSEERITSIIRMTRIGELETTAGATRRNIPEDGILHSHRRENVKSYAKNAVFWDVSPCSSCGNRRFGGTYWLHLQGENNQRAKTR